MRTFTGDAIRKYRKQRSLTQKQLGEKCGINEANIRKYELGSQNPKIETLQKIAAALEIPVTYLRAGITPDPDEVKQKVAQWGISGALAQTGEERLILERCRTLNDSGQKEAVRQVELLTKIPEYRKDDQPPTPDN